MRRAQWCALFFLLATLCCASQAEAQERAADQITIEQAVQEAIENNLGLLADRYNIAIADAHLVTARLRPNPVLTLGSNFPDHPIFQSGVSPFAESAHVDFVFERGGKREERIAVAENARAVTRLQFLNSVRTLMLDVQNACVDLLLAKSNLSLAQENLRAFNEVVQVNSVRVQAGDLAQVELERTKLAALQFANDVRQEESHLLVARQQVQTLLGRSVRSPRFDVAGELRRDDEPIILEDVHQLALRLRPDLQALRMEQARSAADLRLQLAQGKVDYTIGAEFQRQQSNSKDGNQYGLTFSVPIPIFNRNQGEIERAQQEQEQLMTRIRALEAGIRNEAQNAYQQYAAAHDVLQRIETDMLARARDVRQTIEYSYRRGQSSFVEFLDAQRAFNDTMQSYNGARADYARSLYLIDSVSGKAVQQ
jgi:cobalt-zinc-cadmium efflux system outer membrane protein